MACRVQAYELENGNGWNYSINGLSPEPNWDVGETWDNQLGFRTKSEALKFGAFAASRQEEFIKAAESSGEHAGDGLYTP